MLGSEASYYTLQVLFTLYPYMIIFSATGDQIIDVEISRYDLVFLVCVMNLYLNYITYQALSPYK